MSIWPFDTSCDFIELVTAGYHGFPYMLPYILPYFYGNSAPFLLVTILSTLPEVLLNVVQYIFSKITT